MLSYVFHHAPVLGSLSSWSPGTSAPSQPSQSPCSQVSVSLAHPTSGPGVPPPVLPQARQVSPSTESSWGLDRKRSGWCRSPSLPAHLVWSQGNVCYSDICQRNKRNNVVQRILPILNSRNYQHSWSPVGGSTRLTAFFYNLIIKIISEKGGISSANSAVVLHSAQRGITLYSFQIQRMEVISNGRKPKSCLCTLLLIFY